MLAGPIPTDRRAVAAGLCQLLAHGAEDPDISLEQLARAARQIAEFLLEEAEPATAASGPGRRLRVIDGGKD